MPQGTVKTFDPETCTGSLVLDDQTEYPIDPETFLASGLVDLRLGQRVRFELTDDRIEALDLVSF